MNVSITEAFDRLEDEIDEANIPVGKLILVYRELLSKLIEAERFSTISKSQLAAVMRYINKDDVVQSFRDEELRSRIANELADLAEKNKDSADFYHLIRCFRFIFVKHDDWEGVAQDSPIFYFYSYLKKILNDIDTEFVSFFREALSLHR